MLHIHIINLNYLLFIIHLTVYKKDSKLFKAILSMDAYNRGYNAGIDLRFRDADGSLILENGNPIASDKVNTKIGTATIVLNSSEIFGSTGEAKGFYALAYDYGGEAIISYRGTDDVFGTNGNGDLINGWVVSLGHVSSANQAGLAIDFYKNVADSFQLPGSSNVYLDANISLTGHSLGGGLASYIASIYGKNSASYDAMPFTLAVNSTIEQSTTYNATWTDAGGVSHTDDIDQSTLDAYEADPSITVTSSELLNADLKQLVYGHDLIWGNQTARGQPIITAEIAGISE